MAGKEKLFMEACKKKFKEEPTDMTTKYYCYGGWKQSKSKVEFQNSAMEIAKKRGIPMMNEDIGVPLGQRSWMPYQLSHTDIFAEADDLHCVNNCAIQQAWDDIRRTILVGLDSPHQTIERRLGKEVTPETINTYLETVNHTMPGGAVVQEHMAEVNPALVWDSYVKVYSGDDELIDEIDPRFVIDINKLFPAEQACRLSVCPPSSEGSWMELPSPGTPPCRSPWLSSPPTNSQQERPPSPTSRTPRNTSPSEWEP